MVKFLILWYLVFVPHAIASTSLLDKLSTFRFGNEKPMVAQEGSIDVSSLGKKQFYHVQGEILFFPGQFLIPQFYSNHEFQEIIQQKKPIRTDLRFRSSLGSIEQSDENYGTYLMRIRSDVPQNLMLAIPRFYHSLDLYMVSASEVRHLIRLGNVEKDPAKNRNLTTYAAPNPIFDLEGEVYLFAHGSSPIQGGKNTLAFSSFFLGSPKYLGHVLNKYRIFTIMGLGAFLSVFIFYGFIFSFRREDKSSLYLSLYALSSFIMGLRFAWHFNLDPDFLPSIFILFTLLSVSYLKLFALEKLKPHISPKTRTISRAVTILIACGAIIAAPFLSRLVLAVLFILSFIIANIAIVATIYLGFKHRIGGTLYLALGAIFMITFMTPIMAEFITNSNKDGLHLVLLANLSMTICLALVNAKEFAITFKKSIRMGAELTKKNEQITFLNKNLESLVERKTKQVTALLNYIPQGVLSLGKQGIVEKDYSAHLQSILELDEIANLTFKELLIDRTTMSRDEKDQVWQTILSVVGEDEINLIANADKLPGEIYYQIKDRKKCLKVTWNAETDGTTVTRLLVTLLDITIEKQLEKATEDQRKELVLIQELLNVTAHKIAHFHNTSLPLLQENLEVITAPSEELSEQSIRLLFLNAHTIKGEARSLQLKRLANVMHEAEDYYAEILQSKVAIDRNRLKTDLEKAFSVYRDYMEINRNKLNRIDSNNELSVKREVLEGQYYALIQINNDIKVEMGHANPIIEEHCKALAKIIFEPLPQVFAAHKYRIAKIAKELGKAEPILDLDVDDLVIPKEKKEVLDQCMIHILSNAVSHGIETIGERRQKGKPDKGRISISTCIEGSDLQISISDDGCGLAINSIEKKALRKGLLPPHSSVEKIASIIFAPGFSTAKHLTDISGRGVGMDAVRTLIEKMGGSIAIKLGEPIDSSADYYKFHFEIIIPLINGARSKLAKVS